MRFKVADELTLLILGEVGVLVLPLHEDAGPPALHLDLNFAVVVLRFRQHHHYIFNFFDEEVGHVLRQTCERAREHSYKLVKDFVVDLDAGLIFGHLFISLPCGRLLDLGQTVLDCTVPGYLRHKFGRHARPQAVRDFEGDEFHLLEGNSDHFIHARLPYCT